MRQKNVVNVFVPLKRIINRKYIFYRLLQIQLIFVTTFGGKGAGRKGLKTQKQLEINIFKMF